MQALKQILKVLLCFFAIVTTSEATNYVVKKGDNLTKVAIQFDTSVETIVTENEIKNPNHIEVGQKLVIADRLNSPQSAKVEGEQPNAKKVYLWSHLGGDKCNNCDVHQFLKANYPKDIAPLLEVIATGRYLSISGDTLESISVWSGNSVETLTTVNKEFDSKRKNQLLVSLQNLPAELQGEVIKTTVATGDCFEIMMFGKNKTVPNVCAKWKHSPATAVEYRVTKNGTTYSLVKVDACGNWAKRKQGTLPVLEKIDALLITRLAQGNLDTKVVLPEPPVIVPKVLVWEIKQEAPQIVDVLPEPRIIVPKVLVWEIKQEAPLVVVPEEVTEIKPISPLNPPLEEVALAIHFETVHICNVCPEIKSAYTFLALPYGTLSENPNVRKFYESIDKLDTKGGANTILSGGSFLLTKDGKPVTTRNNP